jgi:hypothetical protein
MLISSAQHSGYFSGNIWNAEEVGNRRAANSRFLARHRKPTAHARARYRCFLPDLAGLAGRRRAGPMPDL